MALAEPGSACSPIPSPYTLLAPYQYVPPGPVEGVGGLVPHLSHLHQQALLALVSRPPTPPALPLQHLRGSLRFRTSPLVGGRCGAMVASELEAGSRGSFSTASTVDVEPRPAVAAPRVTRPLCQVCTRPGSTTVCMVVRSTSIVATTSTGCTGCRPNTCTLLLCFILSFFPSLLCAGLVPAAARSSGSSWLLK